MYLLLLVTWHRLSLQVHSTMGPRGRHDCEFAPVAGGPLLLVCITAGEPEQFEEVFGNQTNKKGKVTVYEIKDNPITSGGRYLSFRVVDDIGVEGPRDVEIWCVSNIPYPCDNKCCIFFLRNMFPGQ